MKISIMQPYLFPYIGYFQLIKASDYFMIGDMVQYIQNGWINRNRILINEKDHLITLPVLKDEYHLNINERYFVDDPSKKNEKKLLNTIRHAYRKAPYYKEVSELVEKILYFEDKNVSAFTVNSLQQICNYLGIETKMIMESDVNPPDHFEKQDKIFYICKALKADYYLNAIGGTKMYSDSAFKEENIKLRFVKTRESLIYQQFKNAFVANLSIIDVMMFNSQAEIKVLLSQYDLIEGEN
jgi:hypothetical protein